MFRKVDIYILRQVATPLLLTIGVSALLLLLDKMLRLFDLVANEGGPVVVVFRMLGNLLPQYIGLALPLGFLLGVLLAFRKLSYNSELEAMQTAGLGLFRLLRGSIILSFVLLSLNMALVGYVQPKGIYTYLHLVFELNSGAFGTSIRPGEYIDLGHGLTLRVERVGGGGTRLEGIFAQKELPDGHVSTITARKGSFLATPDGHTVLLRLHDGLIVDVDPKQPAPRVLTFKQNDYPFDMPQIGAFRARGEKERELTLDELWTLSRSPATNPRDARIFASAFLDRILRSLTMLALPFMAVGLGVGPKRQQKQLGLLVAIVLLLTLHKTLEFGTAAAALDGVSRVVNLVLPFCLFVGLSGAFFYTTAYKVGARPLAWIEDGWEFVLSLVLKASFSGWRNRRSRNDALPRRPGPAGAVAGHPVGRGGRSQ